MSPQSNAPRGGQPPSRKPPAGQLTSPVQPVSVNRVDTGIVALAPVLSTLIRWGGAVWMVSYLVPISQALAGKETKASVLLQFLTNLPVRDIASIIFGVSGIGWGATERRLRKRRTAELADQNTELEKLVDPNRSSSGLTRMGEGPTFHHH